MKATFTVARDGHLIRVFTVRLESEKAIASVTAEYEGFELATDTPDTPVTTFERTYRKQEGHSAGTRQLIVSAQMQDGTTESATKIWDE